MIGCAIEGLLFLKVRGVLAVLGTGELIERVKD